MKLKKIWYNKLYLKVLFIIYIKISGVKDFKNEFLIMQNISTVCTVFRSKFKSGGMLCTNLLISDIPPYLFNPLFDTPLLNAANNNIYTPFSGNGKQ